MARTRGASTGFQIPLDRQGNPISPAIARLEKARSLSGNITLQGPGAQRQPPPLEVVGYQLDMRSITKNLEAYDLAVIIDAAFKHSADLLVNGLMVALTPAQFEELPGDARRHFTPVLRPPINPGL